jgi:hypothetical protein
LISISTIQKIALAIVAVGAITALTMNGRQSAQVIQSAGNAFSNALGTAIKG